MTVVITHAVRTPIAKFKGGFSAKTALDLGAAIMHSLKQDFPQPDAVVLGNVFQAGLGQNPARRATLNAGFPVNTSCTTVNKADGSGLEAIAMARNFLLGYQGRCVMFAGGMESMTNAPMLKNRSRTGINIQESEGEEVDSLIHDGLWDCTYKKHMGLLADIWWRRYGINRKELDKYAYESQMKASEAQKKGLFNAETRAVEHVGKDESIRPETSLSGLAKLKPLFKKLGANTSGNSARIGDGAAVVALMDDLTARKEGVEPIAEILGYASVGVDPKNYGLAPIDAVNELLKEHELSIDDIDVFELDETYAVQAIVCMRELDLDPKKINVNGGSIALGRPTGVTGARIVTTLLHNMKAREKDYGIATVSIAGGEGMAMLFRRWQG